MNVYFAAAAILLFILAVAHSILGELLLIGRLRKDSLPPIAPFSLLEVPGMGLAGSTDVARDTLRFTWHLPTVLGFGFGAILLWLSLPSSAGTRLAFVEWVMALSIGACSLTVLVCSKGKHPGWVVFLAVAILIWLGM
jgi:hypothetical protein